MIRMKTNFIVKHDHTSEKKNNDVKIVTLIIRPVDPTSFGSRHIRAAMGG